MRNNVIFLVVLIHLFRRTPLPQRRSTKFARFELLVDSFPDFWGQLGLAITSVIEKASRSSANNETYEVGGRENSVEV
jgi:hypothetical protein